MSMGNRRNQIGWRLAQRVGARRRGARAMTDKLIVPARIIYMLKKGNRARGAAYRQGYRASQDPASRARIGGQLRGRCCRAVGRRGTGTGRVVALAGRAHLARLHGRAWRAFRQGRGGVDGCRRVAREFLGCARDGDHLWRRVDVWDHLRLGAAAHIDRPLVEPISS